MRYSKFTLIGLPLAVYPVVFVGLLLADSWFWRFSIYKFLTNYSFLGNILSSITIFGLIGAPVLMLIGFYRYKGRAIGLKSLLPFIVIITLYLLLFIGTAVIFDSAEMRLFIQSYQPFVILVGYTLFYIISISILYIIKRGRGGS